MKYRIEHQISWQYDQPVFIEPMTIRLHPRCDGSLLLMNWELAIDPLPIGSCQSLDALGNAVSLVWFVEKFDTLTVTTNALVENTRDNPFDYLLTGRDSLLLPFSYHAPLESWLLPYRQRQSSDNQIDQWASDLAARNRDARDFLLSLVGEMFAGYERLTREDGPAYSPSDTFSTRRGACRDLAVLFIDICRAVGVAARFVSGYAFEPDREGLNELHAWAEAYLPGAGWRGYDPTLGLAVADQHVPLAAAPEPTDAAPTAGTFRGTGANSTIEYWITIQSCDDN